MKEITAEAEHEMSIMAPSLAIAQEFDPEATGYGDVKIRWDPSDPIGIARARKAFQKAIDKGFRAIRLDRKDQQVGSYLTTFDPTAERIAFIPQIQGGGPPQGKIGDWAWHIHHAVLYEKLTEPLQNRIHYVNSNKGFSEVPLRLKLMRIVQDQKLMDKLAKAFDAAEKAYEGALDKTKKTADRVGTKDQRYLDDSANATKTFEDLVAAELEIMALHRLECEPDCPWNGQDIFNTKGAAV